MRRPVGYLDDWRLTDHALRRAVKRQLDADQIREARDRPVSQFVNAAGRTVRKSSTCTVVVEPDSRVIITVF